jgi:integrase
MGYMLMEYARENDIVSKNYAEFVKMPKFAKKEKKIFTPEEIAILWHQAEDERVQVILFLIYTGLRIGELCGLRCDHVHLDDGYIIRGEKTDAGKNRVVPLPPSIPELSDFLRGWIGKATGELVIGRSSQSVRNQIFFAALIEYGIDTGEKIAGGGYHFTGDHHTPHSTRHTFASLCSSVGMQPENLQKIIGHASYQTTADIYVHKSIEVLKSEMGKLKR